MPKPRNPLKMTFCTVVNGAHATRQETVSGPSHAPTVTWPSKAPSTSTLSMMLKGVSVIASSAAERPSTTSCTSGLICEDHWPKARRPVMRKRRPRRSAPAPVTRRYT